MDLDAHRNNKEIWEASYATVIALNCEPIEPTNAWNRLALKLFN